jgi:hypothetical protein
MAAALAHLVAGAGDAVGLIAEGGGRRLLLPARGGRAHARAMMAALARFEPGGVVDLDRAIAQAAERLRRPGILIVLSDFYDAGDSTFRELRRAAGCGHDVALVQVMSRAEIEFPYSGDVEFEDLETGARRRLDAGAARRAYRARTAEFLEDCRARAHRDGHEYALMPSDVPPARALRSFLVRRAEMATSGSGRAAAAGGDAGGRGGDAGHGDAAGRGDLPGGGRQA